MSTHRRCRPPPALEALEDRTLPSGAAPTFAALRTAHVAGLLTGSGALELSQLRLNAGEQGYLSVGEGTAGPCLRCLLRRAFAQGDQAAAGRAADEAFVLRLDAAGDLTRLAVPDVDGDDVPDRLAVRAGGGTLSVLLEGDPWAEGRSYAVGAAPVAVAVADLTGSGLPDIAVANADGTVDVLLNNGDGTFRPARVEAVVAGLVADVGGDGPAEAAPVAAGPATGLPDGQGGAVDAVGPPGSAAAAAAAGEGPVGAGPVEPEGANAALLPGWEAVLLPPRPAPRPAAAVSAAPEAPLRLMMTLTPAVPRGEAVPAAASDRRHPANPSAPPVTPPRPAADETETPPPADGLCAAEPAPAADDPARTATAAARAEAVDAFFLSARPGHDVGRWALLSALTAGGLAAWRASAVWRRRRAAAGEPGA